MAQSAHIAVFHVVDCIHSHIQTLTHTQFSSGSVQLWCVMGTITGALWEQSRVLFEDRRPGVGTRGLTLPKPGGTPRDLYPARRPQTVPHSTRPLFS